jgi:hypothetical protein
MAGMAGLLGMTSRKDSKATLTARREALARLKRSEEDIPTGVFGEAAKAVLPDVGILNRAVHDPIGTAKGAAEVASLASPAANAYRAYKLATGGGFSVTGADMQDVEQAAEVASLIPTSKSATVPFNVARKTGNKVIPKAVGIGEDIIAGDIGKVQKYLPIPGVGSGAVGVTKAGGKRTSIKDLAELGYNSNPEEWTLEMRKGATTKVNKLWNERLRGDRRKLGIPRMKGFYEAGKGQPAYRPAQLDDRSVLPAEPTKLVSEFFRSNPRYVEDNPNATIAFGHDVARGIGGPTDRTNVAVIPAATNDAMSMYSFKDFIEKEMKATGLSEAAVKEKWGLNHVYI